jgi:non-ribosomal peptide synthetase component E (peptide arylation enzyme)
MSYRGRVRNGVIVLDSEAVLPEGAVVKVEQVEQAPEPPSDGGWARELLKIAGTATGLPHDLARNHDHYLYGTPKR